MDKVSKILRFLIVILVVMVLVLGFFGFNEIRGAALSFSAFSAQSRMDNAIKAIVNGDAEAAYQNLGYSGDSSRFCDALSTIRETGITILAGKVDWKSIHKSENQTIGEATIQIKASKGHFWAGDENESWSVITVPDHNYDVRFKFSVMNKKIYFGDVVSIYESSAPETKLETIPAFADNLMILLRSCDAESLYAQNNYVITLDAPTSRSAFIDRINKGFHEIVNGNYSDACDFFGFYDRMPKECFLRCKSSVDASKLEIMSASVKEKSIRDTAGITTATVTLQVQQNETKQTFGYMGEWPVGVYSMDFTMQMKDGAITIEELTAIYLPGQSKNSLMIYNDIYGMPVVYDTPAPFMTELWRILQSYNPTSKYAIFWGYGSN